jgi:DNA repair protein RecO (recombination protein O)
MSGRSFTYNALILRVRQSGESNREAFFLTAEEGIIRAMVFGGPKSKLRAYVSPFHSGTLWIYHDPVKDSRKVTDFDVTAWRPGIREVYERTMAAGAITETILAGHGGSGNWQEALNLASESLEAVSNAAEKDIMLPFLHFLWNWADILGIQPNLNNCGVCESPLAQNEHVTYSAYDGNMLCARCGNLHHQNNNPSYIPLSPGARRWLIVTSSLNPNIVTRYKMDAAVLNQVRIFVTHLLTAALGRRLQSWDWKV